MRALPYILLVSIPALIALGHDGYLFYENIYKPKPYAFSLDVLMEEFKFSALGFIWTTYDIESYKETVRSMSPEDWADIDYLLTFKAFYVGLAFAAFWIIVFGFLALFKLGPFINPEDKVLKGASKKGGKMVYNRK